MRNKALWISLMVLLSMAGCKAKVQDASTAPATDAASTITEQQPAPMESAEPSSPATSSSDQPTDQDTQAAIGQNAEQITAQPEENAPAEDSSAPSADAQPDAADPATNGAPADK
jgi:hypothetical protein